MSYNIFLYFSLLIFLSFFYSKNSYLRLYDSEFFSLAFSLSISSSVPLCFRILELLPLTILVCITLLCCHLFLYAYFFLFSHLSSLISHFSSLSSLAFYQVDMPVPLRQPQLKRSRIVWTSEQLESHK